MVNLPLASADTIRRLPLQSALASKLAIVRSVDFLRRIERPMLLPNILHATHLAQSFKYTGGATLVGTVIHHCDGRFDCSQELW